MSKVFHLEPPPRHIIKSGGSRLATYHPPAKCNASSAFARNNRGCGVADIWMAKFRRASQTLKPARSVTLVGWPSGAVSTASSDLPITDYRLPITDTNYQLPITNGSLSVQLKTVHNSCVFAHQLIDPVWMGCGQLRRAATRSSTSVVVLSPASGRSADGPPPRPSSAARARRPVSPEPRRRPKRRRCNRCRDRR